MKIVYLDSGRMPTEKAHGYQIMKMCESMASLGHEVTLVVSSRRNPIKTDPFEFYGLEKNFAFRRLPSIDIVNIFPKFGTWLSRLSFLVSAKIYLMLKKYDLLYLREHMSGLFFNDFLIETHSLPKSIGRRDFRVWQRAKKIAVTTPFIKEKLEHAGIEVRKIIVAPDAVDSKVFGIELSKEEARKQLGLPINQTLLGYTGSLKTKEMEKGIADVLRALKNLPENMRFIAVGGLERHIREYKTLAQNLGVWKKAQFIHRVPPDKLAVYQQAFDCLLLPFPNKEHYAYFASPLKMFEYMASGRPIVSTDLPSIREVLNDKNAVLVQPDSPSDLARGINTVLTDAKLADRIASQAKKDAGLFTWENRAKIILQ
ncbi:MAG: hypothetical protein A3C85_03905 [Candidatus Doudnabacteria bacterium RIFCSPHIGHO2_02_FULL_48_21]|uniref:Glycosyl transferase family 1 domain-containing protein n=1 Tax=Candidatus Doudnabacteria bacterium RIFCSPLOWO2_02_FULL_48_13 TaxID=1817845 RepID=A0A1F5QC15_9BACT|nr:MAG: hypothetical protein A3K05_01710 [Candidatus Doudnabacteria bacterium RIFCSPHIGHO2_01_48_18]OGE78779.1 MAG: hypothetical protein A2668_04585 [Candidatus Doudnabacteria bacterium RIFCSPHIGHO2_01_FULL_48_180]OGE91787.1 MAG: hypothetical protein A3F44_00245 [Candidatus Doudnabacteria bacterium RIFCSPHIGHO2_12_FULL_47_25]OGE93600.1 MAG: hypothetical protein A3C85_03905 [Candidatus Doudnabacteria bacterium RIFCSPHIGHO2_02_FULL_48_21]OGE97888.1 MAG: hypothetical protein A3A83_04645 [Candidatu